MEEVIVVPRKIREALPRARFLNEEEQARYEEAVKRFNSKKARDNLSVPRNGSNIFKVSLLNHIGIPTATLQELDLIAREVPEFLEGHSEDAPAVILASSGDSYGFNDYVAKSLAGLIGRESFSNPVIVEGLVPEDDDSSFYGLRFGKGEKFRVIEAPDFSHRNNGRRFSRINPDYSIEFEDKGSRTLYTRDNGLSRLFLDGGLNLVANVGLDDSGAYGRVVVMKTGEAGSQNLLNDYIKTLKEKEDQEIESVKARY